jgi:pimeloyl-ACP methyl ester carboxylesterase
MRSVAQYVRVITKLLAFGILGALLLMLRYFFKTPQPLEAVWPGASRIYKWTYGHVFYKVEGAENAPPLVMLHAPEVGGSSYEMRHLINTLAQHYRVYVLDLLGFGLSDRPNVDYSAYMYTSLCRDFLSDVVRRPATLLASGLSCHYVVAVAANDPQLCEGLILLAPHSLFESHLAPRWLVSLAHHALTATPLYTLLTPQPVLRKVLAWQRDVAEHSFSREELAYRYASAHQFGAQYAAMRFLAGRLAIDDVAYCLTAVTQPGLIIWDQPVFSQMVFASSLSLPSSSIHVLQHSIARMQEACPEQVVADILEWQNKQATSTQIVSLVTKSQPEVAEPAASNILLEELVETAEPATTEALIPVVAESGNTYEAYCVKCKVKRSVQNASRTVTKNGRNAIEGICPVCGIRLFRFTGK